MRDQGRAHVQPVGSLVQAELEQIDAHWRAASYSSVGQIYLLDEALLRGPPSSSTESHACWATGAPRPA